jgi:DNA (cytosine-5)-methyltransferase 1
VHGQSDVFLRWYKQFGRDDFRCPIVANLKYVWREANNLLGFNKCHVLPIFKEVSSFTQYAPQSTIFKSTSDCHRPEPTIVTPYVRECFGHLQLGGLKPLKPSIGHEFTKKPKEKRRIFNIVAADTAITVGMVISTPPDGSEYTKWRQELAKDSSHDDRWYALVQMIRQERQGKRGGTVFDVTWLYRPVDTPCGQMRYPWQNELFLSTHCTCEEGPRSVIHENEGLGIHTVEFFGGPKTDSEFFVRQCTGIRRSNGYRLSGSISSAITHV